MMHVSSQSALMNRRRFQICKIIIATSLVWFMIDVFLLMYFTDCGSVVKNEDCESGVKANVSKRQVRRAETPVVGGRLIRPVLAEERKFRNVPMGR